MLVFLLILAVFGHSAGPVVEVPRNKSLYTTLELLVNNTHLYLLFIG
jgi:hypothetical protein